MQVHEPGRTRAAELERLADQLAMAARAADQSVSDAAARVRDRLAAGRFDVAVVGEFKRGKSTLLNALVGREVLPVGVLPTTAVAVEIGFGRERAVVHHEDGASEEITFGEVADYVTEDGNPGNRREVSTVAIDVPVELLRSGLVLVDTPGLASAYAHNTDMALAAIDRADGAVVVFSADAPFSEQEQQLLEQLATRSVKTFFVLNRVDHLTPTELETVRTFLERRIVDTLGRPENLFCVSARAALMAKLVDGDERSVESGFAAFERALELFVERDLVDARLRAASRDLTRLLDRLDDTLTLEASALRLDAAELDRRIARFQAAVDEQRRGFDDDRVLLGTAVDAIAQGLAERLNRVGHEIPRRALDRLSEIAARTSIRQLERGLDEAVEAIVRETFERVRMEEAERTEHEWRVAANEFRDRAQARVDAVRDAAQDIFELRLARLQVPDIEDTPEHFFYLFLHLETPNQVIGRWARRLLPSRVVRTRLLDAARRRLVDELDKHAGRARWDLSQRLDTVRRGFESALRDDMSATITDITDALTRVRQRRTDLAADQVEQDRRHASVRATAGLIRTALQQAIETGPHGLS